MEQIYQDRDEFARLVREVAAPDVGRMGIEILSFTIKVRCVCLLMQNHTHGQGVEVTRLRSRHQYDTSQYTCGINIKSRGDR